MEINVTLIIQMLVFATFVWFTMKFVWPPLARALEERQHKIADGLAAAERGHKELELSRSQIKTELKTAKLQATEIIEQATKQASQIIDVAKTAAKTEAQKYMHIAQQQLKQEINHAKASIHKQAVKLAIAGAEKILMREIDPVSNEQWLDTLIDEI